jgi:hypothetical protein
VERSLLPLPPVELEAVVVFVAFDAVLSVVLVLLLEVLVDDDEFEDEAV